VRTRTPGAGTWTQAPTASGAGTWTLSKMARLRARGRAHRWIEAENQARRLEHREVMWAGVDAARQAVPGRAQATREEDADKWDPPRIGARSGLPLERAAQAVLRFFTGRPQIEFPGPIFGAMAGVSLITHHRQGKLNKAPGQQRARPKN
jgi:hypothetical protein